MSTHSFTPEEQHDRDRLAAAVVADERRWIAICFWGEAAARIAEDPGNRR